MKLLFDQNLSHHLVGKLSVAFPDSAHVRDLGLDAATDFDIWDLARSNDSTIVSKDSDFRQLAFLHGPPPKVVWLRVGNTDTSRIIQILLEDVEVIETFASNVDEALLVLPRLEP